MSFTYSTAITRLGAGATSCFKPGSTDAQKLQRLNEVLERFHEFGTWRGVHETISVTSTSGIITLAAAYLRLDALAIPSLAQKVPIKSQQWAFSSGGPMVQDWSLYSFLVAIDLGDNSSGVRRYQITGDTDYLDSLTFSALARKRYTWVTDIGTTVIPDSFQALRQGVLALAMEDEGDDEGCKMLFAEALSVLNGNLQEFEPEERQMVVAPEMGGGTPFIVH